MNKKSGEVGYSFCWVCARQHHSRCIGEAPRFICQACQRRTQEKCVGLAGNVTTVSTAMSAAAASAGGAAASVNAASVSFSTPLSSRPRRSGVAQ